MSNDHFSSQSLSQGTDRAALHVYDPIASRSRDPREAHDATSREHRGDEAGSKGNRGSTTHSTSKTAGVKAKIKKLLNDRPDAHSDTTYTPTLAPLAENARDSDRLFMDVPKAHRHTLKEIVHDPIQVIQSELQGTGGKNFASTVSGTAIVHGADVRLVRAYDKIKETSDQEDKTVAVEEFEELKDTRQDSFVRWTMDEYVHKVKRVQSKTMQLPERKDFVTHRKDGHPRMQWAEYTGHVGYLVLPKSSRTPYTVPCQLEIILIGRV